MRCEEDEVDPFDAAVVQGLPAAEVLDIPDGDCASDDEEDEEEPDEDFRQAA